MPMPIPLGLLLFLGTVLFMEGVAYGAHRWIMHGPGWFLHASHHRERPGMFEWNDLYAVIFAVPSIVLIQGGVNMGWGSWAIWVGAGIAGYGLIYFGFHDVIVHRRLSHRYVARSPYMKRIVQAHRLHHATESKHGSVSYGFLWAPPVEVLKAALAAGDKGRLRKPGGREVGVGDEAPPIQEVGASTALRSPSPRKRGENIIVPESTAPSGPAPR